MADCCQQLVGIGWNSPYLSRRTLYFQSLIDLGYCHSGSDWMNASGRHDGHVVIPAVVAGWCCHLTEPIARPQWSRVPALLQLVSRPPAFAPVAAPVFDCQRLAAGQYFALMVDD